MMHDLLPWLHVACDAAACKLFCLGETSSVSGARGESCEHGGAVLRCRLAAVVRKSSLSARRVRRGGVDAQGRHEEFQH